MCQITAGFRIVIVYADWMSVGMVAISRCMDHTKITFLDRKKKYFIIGIWIYAFLIFCPVLSDVNI